MTSGPVRIPPDFPVVGVVGGGQLARMAHQAGIALGIRLRVLAESADDSAALAAPEVVVGDHRDLDALRAFAAGCDVVTFDHEHVPTEHLRTLVAEGVTLYPGPDALVHAQDKGEMRHRLDAIGVACPPWMLLPADRASAVEGVEAFAAAHGWPVVLKATRGGYDGKGVWVVADAAPRPPRSRPRCPTAYGCWPSSMCRSPASWPRWWPARRAARPSRTRSSRPSRSAASAAR